MVEKKHGQDPTVGPETVFLVDSQPDHECMMMCCGKRTSQGQVDYRLSFQGRGYLFPGIWAAVCQVEPDNEDHVFLSPQVGESLLAIIYSEQSPKQIPQIQRKSLSERNT